MRKRWHLPLWVGLVALAVAVGCGSKTSVYGTVTYDGQPIANGAISFVPADGRGATHGGTITNGAYRIDDVTPGRKIVQIIGTKEVKWAASSADLERMSAEMNLRTTRSDVVFPADTVPEDAKGNFAEIELKTGSQQHDFDLLPPENAAGKP